MCDHSGRVLEAHQQSVVTLALPTRTRPLPESVVAQVRESIGSDLAVGVTFVYDEEGRVKEQSDYIGDHFRQRTTCSYNQYGDKQTFESSEGDSYTFEYEYDTWGNWTRQIVRHPPGGAEGRRTITYYE